MVNFSIVCPIRDEVDIVPITLPSFYSLNPSEVILCLDKPAPQKLVDVIGKVTDLLGVSGITKIIEVEHDKEYNWQQAYIRRSGFLKASNDIILTSDIDLVLDPRIKNYLGLIKDDVGLVSFNKVAYPITIRSAIGNAIQKIWRHESFTGLYAFSRKAWLETEDIEHLKHQITRAEDTHLDYYLTKKYKSRFIGNLENLCLRPKEGKQYQYMQGVNRWLIRKQSLVRMILTSILYFRPYAFVGYMHAKHYDLLKFKIKG
jgi:hypothetical protein